MRLRLWLLMLAFALFSACNEGSFSGQTEQQAKKNPNRDLNNNGDPDGNPDDENDADARGRDGDDDDDDDDDDDVVDLTDPDDGDIDDFNDDQDTDIDSLIGTLGGDPKIVGDGGVSQPDDGTIIFGDNKAFHLGNGEFAATSCLFEVGALDTAGTAYYFDFEVLKDDTEVQIEIGKICGVDYGDTNFASIQDGDRALDSTRLTVGGTFLAFDRITLDRGHYQVLVEAKAGTTTPDTLPTDIDDFIIGDVRVNADKKIKPGRVGARQ